MTDVSNTPHYGRHFERHTKALLVELDYIGNNVKHCPELLGWKPNAHNDGRKGLDELAAALEAFTKPLRSLLSGNNFWMSDIVTDKSGVRDLKELKNDIKAVEHRITKVMESVDQSHTLGDLRNITLEVGGLAQNFEKLRENMLRRILDHANDKSEEREHIVSLSPHPQTKEKEEVTFDPDPYAKRRYLWLFFGILVFRNAILTHIPHMLLYAVLLHLLPAFQISRVVVPAQGGPAPQESWQERGAYCPIISMINNSSQQTTTSKPKPGDATIVNDQPNPAADASRNATPANIEMDNLSRTEEHVMATSGPGLRFVVPDVTAPDVHAT